MKIIPFNNSFVTDQFIITMDIVSQGFVELSKVPEIESVKLFIESTNDIIFPQYQIIEVVEEYESIFPGVEIGTYVLSWFLAGSSSSSQNCEIPDPIEDLYGTAYYILESSIGKTMQVRYISNS